MKKLLIISALTLVIFGAITISTAKIETPVDGNDTYGFPLTYFIRFSGMCDPCPPNPTETYYWELLVDILFAVIISVLGWMVFTKIKTALKSARKTA